MPIRRQYNEILREAFESSLEILGDAGRTNVIRALEESGSYSRQDDTYLSLWRIGVGLTEIFGQGVSEILMERVMLRMDKLMAVRTFEHQ